MSPDSHRKTSSVAPTVDFHTTQWSLVLAAGHRSSAGSDKALAVLCENYWYPLYGYVRRRETNVQEAQDLTQEFFAVMLEKGYLRAVRPERGRFRSFLLTSFKHFLANEWDKRKAKKRGGGVSPVTWDFQAGEARYRHEPTDLWTAERQYERNWALTLLAHVLSRLREEYQARGKEKEFNVLKAYIANRSSSITYADAAGELEVSEGAAKVAAHRLRRRYRELLRSEIAQTVAETGEVEDEIRNLFEALGS